MRRETIILVTVAAFTWLIPATSHADDSASEGAKVRWGMGVKVRKWKLTEREQRLFVADTPGPASNYGAGIDFTRRKGTVELSFGVGIDKLDLKDGYYVEKGQQATTPGKVDYTVFDKLKWLTAEVVIVNHVEIHKLLELRFGAGIGLGYMMGEVRKTDALCTSDWLGSCYIDPNAMEIDKPSDIPPVLPVVNLLVGIQFKPTEFLHLRIDAGLHTTPYVGAEAVLYLW